MASGNPPQDKCLLTIVFDITPSAWGERELKRNASDRQRLSAGKRSAGPAKFESDVIPAVLAFSLAFSSLNRENCLVVVAVAGDETAVVYPRKGVGSGSMGSMVNDPPEMCGNKIDARKLHDDLKLGIAEMVVRAAQSADALSKKAIETAEEAAKAADFEDSRSETLETTPTPVTPPREGAAIAAGLSLALCVINRFMTAALHGGGGSAADALLKRREDEGVLAMIEGKGGKSSKSQQVDEREQLRRARGVVSPRVLIVQATEDRTKDYNAFMNCAFAAVKEHIVIDGCFLPSGVSGQPATSTFLEQACDRTGGVFLTPSGPAQVDGALMEVMVSVFMAPVPARRLMNLPSLGKVDFRARCFETGQSVDIAHVCNQCLSIFKNRPKEVCPTCGAGCSTKKADGKVEEEPHAKRAKG